MLSSPTSAARTNSPSIKRKGRSTSVANNKERIYRYASILESMDVSPREREWIHDSLINGDEQVVDAMEQFTINQNIATVRRALRGRHSPSLSTPVDHLLMDFSTLEMESPAAVHVYDRTMDTNEVNPFVTAALQMSPVVTPSEMEMNPFLQFSPTDTNTRHHRRRNGSSSPATRKHSPPKRPSLLFNEATLSENAPSVFLHSIQERMTPPTTRLQLSTLEDMETTSYNELAPQLFSVAALLDQLIPVARNFDHCYSIGKILGSGKYSVVKECQHLITNERRAVKVIDKRQMMEIRFLKRELEIMYGLQHDGIVQLIELFETNETIYIVMEVCSQELFEYIDRMGPLEESIAQRLIARLVSTVAFLHSKWIVHRDIKPENILIRGTEVWDIKLTDFGIARRLDGTNYTLTPHESLSEVVNLHENTSTTTHVRNRTTRAHTKCGTRDYIAPEVMSGKGYGTEADLWSVGVVTYVLLSGCAPVFLPTADGTKKVFFSEECWSEVSDQVRNFIECLLVRNPEERSTAEEALQHPWLSNVQY